MAELKAKASDMVWIIGPIRETFERRRAKQAIRAYSEEVGMSNINLIKRGNAVSVAYSKRFGQDWGATLKNLIKVDNYIYIEARTEGFIFLRIESGELVEDRLMLQVDELLTSLAAIKANAEHRSVEPYTIETHGINGELAVVELLNTIPRAGDIKKIHRSYIETLQYNQKFQFKKLEDGFKMLADTETQRLILAGAAIVVAVYYLVPFAMPQSLEENIVTEQPYQTYTNTLMVSPAASVRLAQDFNVQTMLEKDLPAWTVYEVQHSYEGVSYSVFPKDSFKPTIASLKVFADENHLKLRNDKGKLMLFAKGLSTPPYSVESDVRMFDIDQLMINITDNMNEVSPYVLIRPSNETKLDRTTKRLMTFEFKAANDHDLLRIASLVDGFPQRYPITMETGNYQVTAEGEYLGQIVLAIYGEKKES